jgi:hypothetical protein
MFESQQIFNIKITTYFFIYFQIDKVNKAYLKFLKENSDPYILSTEFDLNDFVKFADNPAIEFLNQKLNIKILSINCKLVKIDDFEINNFVLIETREKDEILIKDKNIGNFAWYLDSNLDLKHKEYIT